MKAAFIDTSAMAAILFGEPGSPGLSEILSGLESVHASNLMEAELRGAAAREGLDPEAVNDALSRVKWILPDRVLSNELKAVAACGIQLRGADSWHLACALYLAGDPSSIPFMTLDGAQAQAAARMGFRVLPAARGGPTVQEPRALYGEKTGKTRVRPKKTGKGKG